MALDTFGVIWNQIIGRVPSVDPALAQFLTQHVFRDIAERRHWSWLTNFGQFIMPALYNTGTVTCTLADDIVVGTGTAWLSAPTSLVGQQFRIGVNNPIYTIIEVVDDTHLQLDSVWGLASIAGVNYNVYQVYVTPPEDFYKFLTVWDPNLNWQLQLNVQQQELNSWDAQRSNVGQAYCVAAFDYNNLISPPVPRYEVWPHQTSQYVYPFLYRAQVTDLNDPNATLPRYIRGDVILEGALAQCAEWPGTAEKPNPYFNLNLADRLRGRFDKMVAELERQDDEIFESDVQYAIANLPFAPYPLDAKWIQQHSIVLWLIFFPAIWWIVSHLCSTGIYS